MEVGERTELEKLRSIKLGQEEKGAGTFEGVRKTDMESWVGTKTPIVG